MLAKICFYYLIFNGILTFLFLALYGYYCYLIIFKGKIRKRNNEIHQDLVNFKSEFKHEKIEPIECHSCGSIVKLNVNNAFCINCKTPISLNNNYKAVLDYRLKLKSYLGLINSYIFKIKFTNKLSQFKPFFRLHPLVLFIIFIVTLFFINVNVSKSLYADLSGLPPGRKLDDFIGYFYFSLIINCYACYTLPFDKNEEVANLMVEGKTSAETNENCHNCGASINMNNQLIEVCCYCGTQNYNHRMINETRLKQSNLAHHLLKIKTDFVNNYKSRFTVFMMVYTVVGILPLLTIFLPILISFLIG